MQLAAYCRDFFTIVWGSTDAFCEPEASNSAPSPERGWRDTATTVCSVVQWLFEAFRANFIVSYPSPYVDQVDRT